MKTSNRVIHIAMAALLLAVAVYFGFRVANSFSGGLTTVMAYTDSVELGVEAAGLVVREEQLLTASVGSAMVDLSPADGERVAAGGVVATLYASSSGLETKHTILTLEAEIEQLEYALRSSASSAGSSWAESDLLAAIAGFHAASSAGNLDGLEQDALHLRSLIFKRDYARSGGAQDLQSLIDSKNAQLDSLRASLGAASTVIYAPCSGVFSSRTDGLEGQLTPELLERITARQLRTLRSSSSNPPGDAIGKLITSSTWYYAALVPQADAALLHTGHRYPLRFTHDYPETISMELERISDADNGYCALVFSCRTALGDTTLLRRQSVNIITEQITGIRIPRSALRALSRTQTDSVTGEEKEVIVTGVYTVSSRQAKLIPVNVLYQGEDYFLVESVDPDSASRLRSGDEIIVYTAGITDGKVVR